MYIDAIRNDDEIVVWTRDSEGLQSFTEPCPFYCYQLDKNGPYKTYDGHNASKVEFDHEMGYANFVDSHVGLYESDISPLHKFLSDNFYHHQEGPVNVGYYDIEVNFDLNEGKGFPLPENPYGEINSISLFDASQKKYHMIMLVDKPHQQVTVTDDRGEFDVVCHHCWTEKQLLDRFENVIKDIDVLTAWNGEMFDIAYIMERCRLLYGNKKGLKKFSRGGYSARRRDFTDDFGNDRFTYTLVGRVHYDLLLLYKKFTFKEKNSYKLDNVAFDELGEKKLEYPGDLGKLYREDPQTFFDYSLHDSRLLYYLDKKKGLIELAIKMARAASVRFNEIMGSIRYIEHSIRNYAHYEKETPVVLPDVDKDTEKTGGFEGAFVMEPRKDIYGWSQSIDLTSLYPSVIRSLNISPETQVFQCKNGHDDFVKIVAGKDMPVYLIDTVDNEEMVVTGKNISQLLKEENLSISANGSIFRNDIEGLLPEVLGVWFSERKRTKNLSQQLAQDGDDEQAKYYDDLQYIFKVTLNSLYGAIANPFSRFHTLDCAKSVTLTGQEIEKYQSYYIDQIVKEDVDLVKEPDGRYFYTFVLDGNQAKHIKYEPSYVIYGDTDSSYVDLGDLFGPDADIEDVVQYGDEAGQKTNAAFPEYMKTVFNVDESRDDIIQTDREVISDKSLFRKRKYYCMHVVDDEGKRVDKMKIMGLEIIKSDTPEILKDFLTELCKDLMDRKDYDQIKNRVDLFKEKFYNASMYEIGKPTSVKSLADYQRKIKENPNVSLPYHVKASMNYNKLCGVKDQEIVSGDKVKIIYLKHPTMKYIGIPADADVYPDWLDDFEADYNIHWAKAEKIINRYLEVAKLDPDSRLKSLRGSMVQF